jgi:integrase
MEKLTYRFVYNRKHRLNGRGEALVQVEAYGQGRKAYFTTHVYLRPAQWDARRQCVRRHENAGAINLQLRRLVVELEEKELTMRLQGKEVSPALLKEATRHSAPFAFYTFVGQILPKVSHREGTLANRLSTLRAMQKFRPATEGIKPDYTYVSDFEEWLRGQRCQVSTVAKHLKHLRLFINLAIRHGHLPEGSSPFRTYPIPTATHTPVHLSMEELRRLEDLEAAGCPAEHRQTLEAYLFCCYTGLRYSDFTALTCENFVEEGAETWLQFKTVKTGEAVRLPLNHLFEGKALRLYERHRSRPEDLFHLRSDRDANRRLGAIAGMAGITKHLTFHTARHTFATLLIYKGALITSVQKLLGHRRITTTEHYAEVLPEGIVKDLERCEGSGYGR